MNTPARLLAVLATLLTFAGCASLPQGARPDPRDRFERFNRSMFAFNQTLDKAVARPIAVGYRKITPKPVRTSVSNFFGNLGYPTVIVNDLLQGKLKPFAQDTGRLLVNTTIGIGGLFDPATRMGLGANDEDLGQTFGKWGIRSGPYLMLPLMGPSSIRDGVGSVGDHFTHPRTYIGDPYVRYGLTAFELVSKREELLETDSVLNKSFDPYAFVRTAYLQRREYQVHDGDVPEAAEETEVPDDITP
ncbi:MAG: VacJ family lipoprotein [Steroidobacteraceae bacterium]